VLPDLPGVVDEERGAARLVGGLDGLEVGGERRHGVHHHGAPARQPHHEVRVQPPVGRVDGVLLGEVAVLGHAGELDDPLQLDLAPAAANLRNPERANEVRGLGAQQGLCVAERAHLLS